MTRATRRRGPLRLLHVITAPDSLIFFDGQLAFMKRHGFEISMIVSPGPAVDEFSRREGVRIYPVTMPRRMSPVQDAVALGQVYHTIREMEPDVVHAHTAKAGLLGMLAAAMARTPARIYQMRGLLMSTAQGNRRRLFATTERLACAASHHVVCNSHSLRNIVVRAGLCPAEKIEVLLAGSGNGVDSSVRFNPDALSIEDRTAVRQELGLKAGALVVGFVGRLVRDKGVRELTGAWRQIREQVPTAHLVVAGPFEPRDPVSPADRDFLESDPRIHLLGFRRDLPRIYAALDLLLLPTYREGFPNVLLEAQSMQIPLVSTLVEGCVDAVEDGVSGLLVPPGDASALATAALAYLNDPALRARHGSAGRDRVLRLFQRERLWEALLEVYDRHLHLGPRGGRSSPLPQALRARP